ncbi:MAG: tRNA (guanosine(37)-N1)-methyltransferase TrmD [Pigeon pea little leaf phytoplasma]|uniref:tRNA (guanine-N(1)-)-methyltransferase n=1 Tax=Candidatus Phytoplasma fabacearum TaxID=2982628 RepID=A0ABU8ZT85_9MOLU|nr:tRNA (guanosine(37)-N1)-methyltransferase TrmD ['Bituminaria bituminosa' little leaf phytoplasma]MDV3153988.1 tRNA (guanosine(37)-N1)-methyltransferase TrmD [Pigeon pea little leaf phytoplasma]MDO7983458.1 tRNA (guanosine(37)-N1)-methyltransferase TrmD ['Bituminaria bituminosa' little leaf phytoplasma]MDO8023775.1 tRNA (guanosine(37)-N1)-methyltransferase TrmD ['Bituminaria bituminosa' little leaf phytoplasma]MDO8030406.1 tRNA (guanosine(37)-N1)-methyltransferase TrmD ['Bituminaria bituminos
MQIDIITIFPNFFDYFLNHSILKRAKEKNKVIMNIHDLRFYSHNKHFKIDDKPYSGDAGMLLSFPPLYDCLEKIKSNIKNKSKVILLSPQGNVLTQYKANQYVNDFEQLVIICGNYEGVDARILNFIDEELSIGDYVLTGGEIASLVFIDVIIRLIPGVIHKNSYLSDSHQKGLLKYPQYTRPFEYKNYKVPSILLSGDHQKIYKWRLKESLKSTFKKRPDLLEKINLDGLNQKILKEIKNEGEE